MRKLLGVLLAVLLFLSAIPVQAESKPDLTKMSITELTSLYTDVLAEIKARTFSEAASTPGNISDEEILFRKIPWNSSPDEYSSLVGISSLRGPSETSCYSWE